ncbi:saccharopine dehydrogenase [Streptomyces sp. NPDC015346]|uniref:saccharopine dehydrogenase n=1 Tax=Streptomyces sp. NPDC015346 TaxID=3364954 RepID=UPI0036FC55FE
MKRTDVRAGRVLVVGGYGAVGATVTATLGEWFPGRIVPGGRSRGARVDVRDPEGFGRVLDGLGDVVAVVLCVEPPDARVAGLCLERGIHVVDVSADRALLDGVAAHHDLAVASGATAVLSVGVAPGLTNLLAHRAHTAVGGARRLDLTVLLGSGERHGEDAVRWTLDSLVEPAPRGGAAVRVGLPGFGMRRAHAFPFSDQFTLARTLGVPEVTTRFCLDSRPLTAALFALRGTGPLRAAHARPALRRLLTDSVRRVHLGGDGFALRADAYGDGDGDGRRVSYALTGNGQSRASGLVTAHVTRALLTGTLPPGTHHIEHLPPLAHIPEALTTDGVRVYRRSR